MSAVVYLLLCGFCLERFPLPLGAWDGLGYFIVALPEPSYNYFTLTDHGCHYQLHDTIGYIEYSDDDETGSVFCTWTIHAGRDKVIQLAFTQMDIPTINQCTDNYLKVT